MKAFQGVSMEGMVNLKLKWFMHKDLSQVLANIAKATHIENRTLFFYNKQDDHDSPVSLA